MTDSAQPHWLSHYFYEVWRCCPDGFRRLWAGCSCGWVGGTGGHTDRGSAQHEWQVEHLAIIVRARLPECG